MRSLKKIISLLGKSSTRTLGEEKIYHQRKKVHMKEASIDWGSCITKQGETPVTKKDPEDIQRASKKQNKRNAAPIYP